jgi:acyl-coenzyme A synthetase/AMP-(fatty) acid ligase
VSRAERIPLVGHRDLDRPVAWRGGAPVSCARFLAEAAALAGRLPAGRYLVNVCEDRYRFAVALAAALLAGKTSLFPPSRGEHSLARVAADYPDCGAIAEEPVPALGDRLLLYPADPGPGEWSGAPPAIAPDHVAAIVFTSGSTGVPQPNVKCWGKLVAGGAAERAALGLAPGGFNVLGTVPPQHMYGLESTVLLPLAAGGALHPGRPLFPRDVQAALEQLPAPRVLVTSPIHIRACVEADVAFPPLELILSAAAPLAPELAAAAERRFATRVHEIYGCTEAGQVATRRTAASQTWRAIDGIRVVPVGGGCAVEGGPVHGRVPLGDLIRPLSETEFLLEGRAADLVNVAGKRASVGDLNRALVAIPGVEDGAFHVPEHADGRVARLMAFVVAPRRPKREIVAALRRTIDPAFLPRPLVKVEHLPRTPTGKLPLEALRALEAEHRGRARGAHERAECLQDGE